MSAPAAPVMSPRSRVSGGCCEAAIEPDLERDEAASLAQVAKALGDPTRLLIVDVLRKAAPEAICQCELKPLFDMSQPALAKHLRVLLDAGVIASERRGAWVHYFIPSTSRIKELTAWLA